MKYNDNGTYKDIYVKTFDTLPVGTEVDYDGSVVPDGWTEVETYSTNEVNTGQTWIDGKSLYRKVITGTKVSGSTLIITINSCDTIINVYGYIKVNDNGTYYEYPLNYYESSSSLVRTNWMNGQILIRSSTGTFINGEAVVIAEYTKTTD